MKYKIVGLEEKSVEEPKSNWKSTARTCVWGFTFTGLFHGSLKGIILAFFGLYCLSVINKSQTTDQEIQNQIKSEWTDFKDKLKLMK